MSDNKNDTIFIGKKPLMTYVTSAIIQLSALPSITIKARGLSIGLAVDVSQVILRKTNAFEIGNIKISSESLESSDGKKRNVSTIEIPVSRTGQ
jgi:DNA-binding protein